MGSENRWRSCKQAVKRLSRGCKQAVSMCLHAFQWHAVAMLTPQSPTLAITFAMQHLRDLLEPLRALAAAIQDVQDLHMAPAHCDAHGAPAIPLALPPVRALLQKEGHHLVMAVLRRGIQRRGARLVAGVQLRTPCLADLSLRLAHHM